VSEFKGFKVNRITVAMVEKCIGEHQTVGMPIATIRKILVSLNQIMKYAARRGYISYNPLSVAERPRAAQRRRGGVLCLAIAAPYAYPPRVVP
jgi:site-specific recombinase XerD